MVRKPILQIREGLGNGKGPAEVYHIVPKEDLYGHGRMYAKIVLPAGSYVGWHQHIGETEPYFILEGEGIFTDNDGDGLPDILEEEGMYDLNGNQVYYSDPTVADTDGDGLTDGEEMGTMISIRRADEDHVQFNGIYMELSEVSNSQYADFEQLIPENPGDICFVFDVQSNPNNPDSDGDEYLDYEDGIPFQSNPDIVYVLYSATGDWFLQYEANSRLLDYNCDVVLLPVTSSEDFEAFWNGMGIDEDERYIYHIREVVTIFHGDNQTITMDTHPNIVKVDVDTKLRHHKIDTLRLSSCNNGNIDDPNNIARSFMNWGTIGEVYAWDGQSSYISTGELKVILPAANPWIGDSYIVLDYSLEYSASNLRSLLVIILAGGMVGCQNIGAVDWDLGLVRYYYDESTGEIEYENISDSSIYAHSFYCG